MFSKGIDTIVLEKKHTVSDADIVAYYLGVTSFPARIHSPIRVGDDHPSFGLYSRDGEHIYYVDWATQERGSVIDLLMKMWGTDYSDTWGRIVKEVTSSQTNINCTLHQNQIKVLSKSKTQIQVKVRDWKQYDIDYWKSYGISLEWLKFANVYPISHIIFTKENKDSFTTPAEKLAYVFVEFKEGHTTYKVYQPHSKRGFKWFSSHDSSVISLWAKVPEYGEQIVICSSLKDALCLWANTGIPAIAPQGEGYTISDTAISELKRRYKEIYILYDNDDAGEKDSEKLANLTGFKKVSLPKFEGGKDISDRYKQLQNPALFKAEIINILKTTQLCNVKS